MDYDDDTKSHSAREKAFISILADGLKSVSEEQLRTAVSHSVLTTVKEMKLERLLEQVMRPIVEAELARLKDTPEFKERLAASVGNAMRDVVGRLQLRDRW